MLIKISSATELSEIEKLDIDEYLYPNRHVGVYAIIELLKQQARNLQLTVV